MKMWFRILIDAVIIVFVLTLIFGWRALMPVRMQDYLLPSDFGMPYENIVLETRDGVKLGGWLIPSEKSKGIVICLHGYPANKSDILPVISFLYPEFSLLLFDFRAHGNSGGKITYFGLKESLDVEAALRFIRSEEALKDKKTGIWGYSMGGAVGIISSARYGGIDALVTDSAFANFPEMVMHYYGNFGPLKYVFSALSTVLGRYVFGFDFFENSPENFINGIKAPVFLIHSKQDEFVPYGHAERLFMKAPEPKRLWAVEGAHTGLDRAFTGEYQDAVKEFFLLHLNPGS